MDGLTAPRKICEKYPENENPWVITFTAATMGGDKERAFKERIRDFITKPVKAERLIKALKKRPLATKLGEIADQYK